MVAAVALLTAFVQHFFLRGGRGGGATCGSRLDAAGSLGDAAATARPDTTGKHRARWDSALPHVHNPAAQLGIAAASSSNAAAPRCRVRSLEKPA